jgi:hypothetical protein
MVLLTGANTRILQLAAIDEQIELCRQELAALVAGVDAELAECRGELHGILGSQYEWGTAEVSEGVLKKCMIRLVRIQNLMNTIGLDRFRETVYFDELRDLSRRITSLIEQLGMNSQRANSVQSDAKQIADRMDTLQIIQRQESTESDDDDDD